MGWTGTHRNSGQSNVDYFREELLLDGGLRENGTRRHLLLDGMTININGRAEQVFYGAVRDGNEPEKVWALVVLMNWSPGEYNLHYKEMSEHMGPNEAECPERILKMLTPPTHYDSDWTSEEALRWRDDCWKRINDRKARPTVKRGDVIRFAAPLEFANGDSLDTFEFVERSTFKAVGTHGSYGRYRIPKWKERDYVLVVKETVTA